MSITNVEEYALRLLVALVLGSLIGAERQFRQRLAGLRTNALVCVGAALFVSMSALDRSGDPMRIAAQVVSGIGFLAGGVIFREGLSVQGLNTAATLWSTAAVGSLAGFGYPIEAAIGTAVILFVHVVLRPLVGAINARSDAGAEVPTTFEFHSACRRDVEERVRTALIAFIDARGDRRPRDVLKKPTRSVIPSLSRDRHPSSSIEAVTTSRLRRCAPDDRQNHRPYFRKSLGRGAVARPDVEGEDRKRGRLLLFREPAREETDMHAHVGIDLGQHRAARRGRGNVGHPLIVGAVGQRDELFRRQRLDDFRSEGRRDVEPLGNGPDAHVAAARTVDLDERLMFERLEAAALRALVDDPKNAADDETRVRDAVKIRQVLPDLQKTLGDVAGPSPQTISMPSTITGTPRAASARLTARTASKNSPASSR